VTEAKDGSFKVEGQTQIFTNVKNPAISGTLFNAFAIKSLDGTTVHVAITDTASAAPSLC
jgi:hypothetical protein